MGEAAKDILVKNIQALLALDEPDVSKRASLLADRMGISLQSGHSLLLGGCDSLSTIVDIAAALDVPPSTLIDAALTESNVVRAQLSIDSVDYPVVAWLDPKPTMPWNADRLVGRHLRSGWNIARFAAGERAPCFQVRHYHAQGEPVSRPRCSVAVYVQDAVCMAEAICEGLAQHGFTPVPVLHEQELYAAGGGDVPDVVILAASNYETVCGQMHINLGRIVPTIVLDDENARAKLSDPARGIFFAEETAISILTALRSVFYFSRHRTPTHQPMRV